MRIYTPPVSRLCWTSCSRSLRSPVAWSTTRSSLPARPPTPTSRGGSIRASRSGLAARGIERLYTHQAEAIEAIHEGRDTVVVTPTASGKTLCYALPVLQALAEDPSARALFLFPTKRSGRTRSPSSASCRASPAFQSPRPPTTATPRHRSARRSARPARSW